MGTKWTTESLRAALDSGDLGFWEEDNHGASSPDRRYGAWIETDDLPSPEEFDAWLAAHDAEIKAEARSLAAASARFWRLVDVGSKTECWPWQGSVLPFGHGQFVGPFGSSTAHRYAWAIVHAEMPEMGLVVRHRCDNPICCNPSHLEIGTQAENVADMINRGRASFTPTTCRKGHPRTPDNTITKADGTRRCKTCSREQQRARRKSLAVLRCPECRHVANVYNLRRHLIRVHGIAESATALRARAAAIRGEQ